MSKLALLGALCSAALWGYVAIGPRGLLPRPAGIGLPMPEQQINDQGAVSARVDAAAWVDACEEAGLPILPDPNGLELEPLRRLVEASRRWAESGDGDELGRMGEVAMALELHELAIDYFAAAKELGTRRARWTYFLGAEYQKIGATDAALHELEEAREADPAYGTTHLRLGTLYLELAELERADEAFARAAERPPAPSAGVVGRGRVALAERSFDAALGYLDTALRTSPRDFIAHRLRSQALAGLGRAEEAALAARISNQLPPYRGWLSFDPRLAEAHEGAGTQHSLELALNAAIARGDFQAAAVAGEALLERLPRSPQLLSVLSGVLANAGQLPRALELARRAVDLEPDNLKALRSLADIASSAGEFEVGTRAAEAIVRLAPESAEAHLTHGRALFFEGRLEDSLAALRRAVSIEPRVAKYRLMLVDVLQRASRFDEAKLELQGLLAIEPGNAQARQRLEALRSRQ